LADVGAKRTRQEIIESVTRPNAKIVEGFQTTSLLLDTGTVVTGILRHEDDEKAVLLNADGKEVEVELDAVEDRAQGLSAMPEDLMKFMSHRDLRDVVEFLSSQRKTAAGDGGESGHQLEP
jgi:putative heme-binding domain-containing protein